MNIYDIVYKERRKKVGKEKAKYSAISAQNAYEIREWNKENLLKNKILKEWKKEKNKIILEEEKNNYRIFKIENENVIVTTDKKVLKDYSDEPRKGKIGEITDEYEREIINKLVEKNDVKIDPNLYYVIFKG